MLLISYFSLIRNSNYYNTNIFYCLDGIDRADDKVQPYSHSMIDLKDMIAKQQSQSNGEQSPHLMNLDLFIKSLSMMVASVDTRAFVLQVVSGLLRAFVSIEPSEYDINFLESQRSMKGRLFNILYSLKLYLYYTHFSVDITIALL